MLLSMTGYGEARYQSDALHLAVELRAVNNRYLKVILRAAEPYNLLEAEFEKVVRRIVRRGTLQVHLPSTARQRRPGLPHQRRSPCASYVRAGPGRRAASSSRRRPRSCCSARCWRCPAWSRSRAAAQFAFEEEWPLIEQVLAEA